MLKLDTANFDSEVKESNVPVVVDFWASWCGPCQMMGPVFEEISKDFEGKAKFAKLNTDEEHDIAGRYNISSIPCLIVFDKGEEKQRIIGFRPKDDLKDEIQKIIDN